MLLADRRRPWSTASTPLRHIPVDAIPDLSDTQVIVYSRWDRSPDIIEDQVTYPIVTALLGAPQREGDPRLLATSASRYVYVIFQDGTDLYWARSRVLEYLSKIQPRLPEGVQHRARPRRDRRRLGLPVRARRRLAAGTPSAELRTLPGLEPALSAAGGARRRRGRVASAASSSSTR